MAKHIAVIGGGMAGLAAATTLVSKGEKVTLLEANHTLGGRARGVEYNQLMLDNGQHILLGAYHETLRLLALANVDIDHAFKRLPLALTIRDLASANTFQLTAPPLWPAPLHILVGLLRAKGMSFSDKFHAIHLLSWMKWHAFKLKQDESLLALLVRQKQSQLFIQQFWEPLCLSALNTPIQNASAQVFLNVLRDSFSKKKHDADLLLPTQDLSSLLSTPLANYIIAHGGEIQCGTTISSATPTDDGYALKHNHQSCTYSHVVLACGPHQIKNLTALLPQLLDPTSHFSYQPITTVYLQYQCNARLPQAMLGSINSLGQWIFDRGELCGQKGLIAVVISAHATFLQSQADLADTVASELAQYYPHLGKPLWHKVITEKRATFSCDARLSRPPNATNYRNLLLAGDYTAGDYPATIEGAIQSGVKVANLILNA